MATAYIETTIPSYYTSRPARDVVQLTRQSHTKIWWDGGCSGFELFTSQETVKEASRGDIDVAAKRLELLSKVSVLEITPRVEELTKRLLAVGLVPASVASDAIHIATASVHGMDFLVTPWLGLSARRPLGTRRRRPTLPWAGRGRPRGRDGTMNNA